MLLFDLRIRFLLVLIIVSSTLLLGSCKVYQATEDPNRGINKFLRVEIGGIKQAVMVRGRKVENPVMVYLHGGPGFPLFPFEPMDETMKRLEEDYTMIYWEQRGTGRSFSRRIAPGTMTLDQFVEDTRQVVEYARRITGQQKVFIYGHSWGSNIGAMFAAQYPEMVHAYISTGQSVNPFKNERLNYEFVMRKALESNNRRALRQMSRIDTISNSYTLRDALVVRKWVYHYGGVVKLSDDERPYLDLEEAQIILTSPFYSLGDRINMLMFPYFSANELWEDLKSINLEKDVPRIEVPVYFLIGRHDVIVSAELAESYFEMLDAPKGKTLVWFENSAHRPHSEEREKFLNVLKQKVVSEVLDMDPPLKTVRTLTQPRY